jgi:hypothetical protein
MKYLCFEAFVINVLNYLLSGMLKDFVAEICDIVWSKNNQLQ